MAGAGERPSSYPVISADRRVGYDFCVAAIEAMIELDWTYQRLAHECATSPTHMKAVINGDSEGSWWMWTKILDVLGLEIRVVRMRRSE